MSLRDLLEPKNFDKITDIVSDVFRESERRLDEPNFIFRRGTPGAMGLQSARELGTGIKERATPITDTFIDFSKRFVNRTLELINPGQTFVEPALEKRGVSTGVAFGVGLGLDILAPGPGELGRFKKTGKISGIVAKKTKEIADKKNISEFLKKPATVPKIKKAITPDESGNYSRAAFDDYLDSIPGDTIPVTHETTREVAERILAGEALNEDIFASLGFRKAPEFVFGEDAVRILIRIPKKEVAADPARFGQRYFIGLDTMDHSKAFPFVGQGGHISTPVESRWIVDIVDARGRSLLKK